MLGGEWRLKVEGQGDVTTGSVNDKRSQPTDLGRQAQIQHVV